MLGLPDSPAAVQRLALLQLRDAFEEQLVPAVEWLNAAMARLRDLFTRDRSSIPSCGRCGRPMQRIPTPTRVDEASWVWGCDCPP